MYFLTTQVLISAGAEKFSLNHLISSLQILIDHVWNVGVRVTIVCCKHAIDILIRQYVIVALEQIHRSTQLQWGL